MGQMQRKNTLFVHMYEFLILLYYSFVNRKGGVQHSELELHKISNVVKCFMVKYPDGVTRDHYRNVKMFFFFLIRFLIPDI